ncbi:MAG: hypothetical protein IJ792_03850 [Oscillospiraceae bacterium]|nr:hypothetical protein [Oscillospiraceae bacterium]
MLIKLLKYEFKSSARTFGLVYLAIFALCVLNGILSHFNQSSVGETVQGIAATALIFFAAAAFLINIVLSINRFGKGVYRDEGYLLHTLPVRADQILAAKLIPATLWSIATGLVMLVSVFLLCLIAGEVTLSEAGDTIRILWNTMLDSNGWMTVLLTLLMLVQFLLQVYASIALGNLFQKHKSGISVVIFFAFYILQSEILVLLGHPYLSVSATSFLITSSEDFSASSLPLADMAYLLVWSVISWVITQLVLSKKLNLE